MPRQLPLLLCLGLLTSTEIAFSIWRIVCNYMWGMCESFQRQGVPRTAQSVTNSSWLYACETCIHIFRTISGVMNLLYVYGHISLNNAPIWKIQKLDGSWELGANVRVYENFAISRTFHAREHFMFYSSRNYDSSFPYPQKLDQHKRQQYITC